MTAPTTAPARKLHQPWRRHLGFDRVLAPGHERDGYVPYPFPDDVDAARLLAEWEHELGDWAVAHMAMDDPDRVLAYLRFDDVFCGRRGRDGRTARGWAA